MPEGLSESELLRRVPGATHEALRRLRDEVLMPRPVRHGLGRGKGISVRYPPEAAGRLRRIYALRRAGVRDFRDLRWAFWWDSENALWSRVQHDLVTAFPTAMSALADLRATADEALDTLSAGTIALADHWQGSRYPSYNRRRLREARDVQAMAGATLGLAFPAMEIELAALADENSVEIELTASKPTDKGSERTYSDLLDEAWGEGAGRAAEMLNTAGACDFTRWLPALQCATPTEARIAATLWRRAYSPRAFEREWRFFGHDWSDRAVFVAGLLYACEKMLQASQVPA